MAALFDPIDKIKADRIRAMSAKMNLGPGESAPPSQIVVAAPVPVER